MFANTFLQSDNVKTVATKYVAFVRKHNSNLAYIYTAGALVVYPVILTYLIFQRKFIEGMIQSGLKE